MAKAKRKLDIRELIRNELPTIEEAAEARDLMASDPIQALASIADLMQDWKDKGPDQMVYNDAEYQAFVRNITRQLKLEFFLIMRESGQLLAQKLQTAGNFIDPSDLAAILSQLGKIVKEIEKEPTGKPVDRPPADTVKAELAKLRQELSSGTNLDESTDRPFDA